MITAYDVPSKDLIGALAKKLQSDKAIVPPEWANFARTGVDRENPPMEKDWWHTRCASILRKIYINNCIGIEHLKAEYGGNRDRGSKPNKARSGSGSIARKAVQQLEKAGYLSKVKGKGRMLTPKGRSFLDGTSKEVAKNLADYSSEPKNIKQPTN